MPKELAKQYAPQEVEQDIAVNGNRVEVLLSASYQWWTIDIHKEKKIHHSSL